MAPNDEEVVQKSSLEGSVKVVKWVAVILLIVAVVSAIRSSQLQDSVDKLENHTAELTQETNEAKVAAVEARDVLNKAIKQGQDSAASPTAVTDALRAIARIEQHLCGGPCDEVDQ